MSYGDLVKGQQLKLTIPVKGDLTSIMGLTVDGNPPLKPVSQYTVIGKSFRTPSPPPKSPPKRQWAVDVRLPDMLHARMVHPKTLGSTLISAGARRQNQIPEHASHRERAISSESSRPPNGKPSAPRSKSPPPQSGKIGKASPATRASSII